MLVRRILLFLYLLLASRSHGHAQPPMISPPAACELNAWWQATWASGNTSRASLSFARVDVESASGSLDSAWQVLFTQGNEWQVQSVSNAILVNVAGPGGVPCRIISMLPKPISSPSCSFTYTAVRTPPSSYGGVASLQSSAPAMLEVDSLSCSPGVVSSQSCAPPAASFVNCTVVWSYCCGGQLPSPPAPLITVFAAPASEGEAPMLALPPPMPPPAQARGPSVPTNALPDALPGAVGGGAAALVACMLTLAWRRRRRRAQVADGSGEADAGEADAAPLSPRLTDTAAADDQPANWLLRFGLSRTYDGTFGRVHPRRPSIGSSAGSASLKRSTSTASSDSSTFRATAGAANQKIPHNELELLDLLGSGGYGSVYRARWRHAHGDEAVAVKVMHLLAGAATNFEHEAAIVAEVSHPHIVRMLGVSFSEQHACIITELITGGSLHDFLHRENGGRRLTYVEALRVGVGVASAMTYLHERRVIHRDLKPANVLLDSALHARICDFGISRFQPHTAATTAHHAGTPAYMAPELFGHGRVTERCDCFSFAILLNESLTGQVPWAHLASPVQVIYAVGVNRERPAMLPACPSDLAALLSELWEQRPERRPPFEQVEARLRAMAGELALPCEDGTIYDEKHRTL